MFAASWKTNFARKLTPKHISITAYTRCPPLALALVFYSPLHGEKTHKHTHILYTYVKRLLVLSGVQCRLERSEPVSERAVATPVSEISLNCNVGVFKRADSRPFGSGIFQQHFNVLFRQLPSPSCRFLVLLCLHALKTFILSYRQRPFSFLSFLSISPSHLLLCLLYFDRLYIVYIN